MAKARAGERINQAVAGDEPGALAGHVDNSSAPNAEAGFAEDRWLRGRQCSAVARSAVAGAPFCAGASDGGPSLDYRAWSATLTTMLAFLKL